MHCYCNPTVLEDGSITLTNNFGVTASVRQMIKMGPDNIYKFKPGETKTISGAVHNPYFQITLNVGPVSSGNYNLSDLTEVVRPR